MKSDPIFSLMINKNLMDSLQLIFCDHNYNSNEHEFVVKPLKDVQAVEV